MARVNLPIRYSQFNPEWANTLLGNNTQNPYNLYNYGCLLSSLANVCKYYGYDETPLTLQDKLKAVGGFTQGGGDYIWGSITKVYPDIQEQLVPTPAKLTDEQMNEIKRALDAGKPVMLNIDYNPKTVQAEDHFSLIVDYDPADENNLTLADTLGGVLRSLRTYLAWFKPEARDTIEKYAIYTGPQRAVASPVETQPAVSALPANYDQIVHGSTQWDETVKTYNVGKPPHQTNFGEVNKKIGEVIEEVASAKAALTAPVETTVTSNTQTVVVKDEHAASQWAQTVEYLELGKQPDDALFEDAKRVIAGLKSAKTDYDNKRIEAEKLAAQKDIKLTNKDAEISNLRKRVTTMEKLHKAEINALIANTPTFTKLKTQFEGVVRDLQADFEKATETAAELRLELSDKQIENGVGEVAKAFQSGNREDILALVGKTAGYAGRYITAFIKDRFKRG